LDSAEVVVVRIRKCLVKSANQKERIGFDRTNHLKIKAKLYFVIQTDLLMFLQIVPHFPKVLQTDPDLEWMYPQTILDLLRFMQQAMDQKIVLLKVTIALWLRKEKKLVAKSDRTTLLKLAGQDWLRTILQC
jgi:hypothetical protein